MVNGLIRSLDLCDLAARTGSKIGAQVWAGAHPPRFNFR